MLTFAGALAIIYPKLTEVPEVKVPDISGLTVVEAQKKLKDVGLWDVNPLNLYRISWKNEPKIKGGLYQDLPNYVEIPFCNNPAFKSLATPQ